jgi:hypothetical protein
VLRLLSRPLLWQRDFDEAKRTYDRATVIARQFYDDDDQRLAPR